jgi:hypothetical protein
VVTLAVGICVTPRGATARNATVTVAVMAMARVTFKVEIITISGWRTPSIKVDIHVTARGATTRGTAKEVPTNVTVMVTVTVTVTVTVIVTVAVTVVVNIAPKVDVAITA